MVPTEQQDHSRRHSILEQVQLQRDCSPGWSRYTPDRTSVNGGPSPEHSKQANIESRRTEKQGTPKRNFHTDPYLLHHTSPSLNFTSNKRGGEVPGVKLSLERGRKIVFIKCLNVCYLCFPMPKSLTKCLC